MIDARLDLKRRQRLGMVEAIWGEHKTAQQIAAILERFAAAGELGLVTGVGEIHGGDCVSTSCDRAS